MSDITTLSNPRLTVRVSSHGAELHNILCQGREYLWQADPAFWARRSPVLFPIVGSVRDNTYRHEGTAYTLTQHGFARDMEFERVHLADDEVLYRLCDNEETRRKYPFPFRLETGYRLTGQTITVSWRVTNPGDRDMHFQIGAHPAFFFPPHDTAGCERGFFRFDRTEGLHHILIAGQGCADPDTTYPTPLTDGLLPIDTHTFDRDALILEGSQVGAVTLCDTARRPCLTLRFDAPVVGLWSPPGKDAPFVCIEPWYGRCDRTGYTGEYRDRDWTQHLKPGATFTGGYTIEVH